MVRSLELTFCQAAKQCPCCGGPIDRWANRSAYGYTFFYDRCRQCGLVFVNPRPMLESIEAFYASDSYRIDKAGDVAADAGSDESVLDDPRPTVLAHQGQMIDRMLRFGPPRGRMLDVGAGRGEFTAAALDRGLEVTAVEVNPHYRRLLSRLPGVELGGRMFEQLDADQGMFGYILMSQVLEHAADPDQWVHKANRLLAPGGVVGITLPNYDSVYRRLLGAKDPFFIPPEHLNHFNRRSLSTLCAKHGLRTVNVHEHSRIGRDVLSKRLRRPRWLVPVIEAGTAVAGWVFKALTPMVRCGVMLDLIAVKPSDG